MILEPRTVNILKNFASLNPSVQIKRGDVITTISPQKTVMARAKINQSFDRTFAIYDLSRFLGVMSLFSQPEVITDNDAFLTIKDGRQKVKYMFADASMISVPPEKTIKLPTIDVEFDIGADDLSKIMKALVVMQMSEIAIVGDGESISIKTVDSKGATQDSFSITVGNTERTFSVILRADNMKLISGNYSVKISKGGLVQFTSDGIEYWIASEASSTFTD